jgi:exosome complex exonuclease DIS3/RRP44
MCVCVCVHTQVRFELDSETHDPINVSMYEHKETNGMVEEMMLLANMSVATKIHQVTKLH